MRRFLVLSLALAGLAGCDALGIDSPEKVAALREADGKAIGGACRHAGRAIEDCYALNKKADRAAVFAGWREMNDYMRENKIDEVRPQVAGQGASTPTTSAAAPEDEDPPKKPKGRAADGKANAKHNDA